jgi:hypothetical protein
MSGEHDVQAALPGALSHGSQIVRTAITADIFLYINFAETRVAITKPSHTLSDRSRRAAAPDAKCTLSTLPRTPASTSPPHGSGFRLRSTQIATKHWRKQQPTAASMKGQLASRSATSG